MNSSPALYGFDDRAQGIAKAKPFQIVAKRSAGAVNNTARLSQCYGTAFVLAGPHLCGFRYQTRCGSPAQLPSCTIEAQPAVFGRVIMIAEPKRLVVFNRNSWSPSAGVRRNDRSSTIDSHSGRPELAIWDKG
jgi:hypothetical protein